MSDPKIGQTIGKYRIDSRIGQGGMGVVYRGHQLSLNRPVAIKVLPRLLAADEEFVQRFRQEAEVIANLAHDNIVYVYDIDEEGGDYFIVMEFVDGESLRTAFADQALPPEEVQAIGVPIAQALHYAHQRGIVHRDVKASNVMVTREGKVKLMDFGIARVSGSGIKTRTGSIMGTPEYMAPEQARSGQIGPQTDVYALGVVLYELATGRLPFVADDPFAVALKHISEAPTPPGQVNPNVPGWLEQIILKAMAKDPADRYASAGELERDLLAGLDPGMAVAPTLIRTHSGQTLVAPTRMTPVTAHAATAPTVAAPGPLSESSLSGARSGDSTRTGVGGVGLPPWALPAATLAALGLLVVVAAIYFLTREGGPPPPDVGAESSLTASSGGPVTLGPTPAPPTAVPAGSSPPPLPIRLPDLEGVPGGEEKPDEPEARPEPARSEPDRSVQLPAPVQPEPDRPGGGPAGSFDPAPEEPAPPSGPSPSELWREARRAEDQERWDDALDALDQLLALEPDRSDARSLREEVRGEVQDLAAERQEAAVDLLDELVDAVNSREIDDVSDLWDDRLPSSTRAFFADLFDRYDRLEASYSGLQVSGRNWECRFTVTFAIRERGGRSVHERVWNGSLEFRGFGEHFLGGFPH